jgi:cytochrome c5
MIEEHETPIKTPKQLITVVSLALVVPVLIIVLLVMFVGAGKRTGSGSDAMSADAIETRIRPVAGFELVDASAPKVLKSGEQVYLAQCAACHTAGVAGAPKFADAEQWAARLPTGLDSLVNAVIKGKGAMAAQAGGAASDYELLRAVVYMSNAAGGKFEEPPPPAEAAK